MIPSRRFGRTEINMPVLSLGGMRFQQSWKDLSPREIKNKEQLLLEKIVNKARLNGLNHIETARHYGSSELQLGWIIQQHKDENRILQTKIPPNNNPLVFEKELELSFQRLKCKKLDLLAIHGINLSEHLEMTIRPGGCLEVAREWQKNGRIDHIGFSTHAQLDLIIRTIETNLFDFINLHWYFIKQDNEPAIAAAKKLDLGVFIISPTDKGGHLHTPSRKLISLCEPLHPIVFNDLFCLRDNRIHTLSVGASRPEDIDLHLKAVSNIDIDQSVLDIIEKRLLKAANDSLGEDWMRTWHLGLPHWSETPGEINIPFLLWLYNLFQAWDLDSFVKDRYNLLGRGGHWLPGANADSLDREVNEASLHSVLGQSPWKDKIPGLLRELRDQVGSERRDRLWGV